MSTNFYVRDTILGERRHLGKRHAGRPMSFTFRAHPALGITDTQSWLRLNNLESGRITDEYGRFYTADEFLETVEECTGKPTRWQDDAAWTDDCGNYFLAGDFC